MSGAEPELRAHRLIATVAALLAATPLVAAPKATSASRGRRVEMIVPRPRPAQPGDAPPLTAAPPLDLSHALSGKVLATLPTSAQQLQTLDAKLDTEKPKVEAARQKSESLAAATAALRQKLIATAARIQALEAEKRDEATRIAALRAEDARLSAGFRRDRVSVMRLLALIEGLQHDMPPALAVRPDDVLAAARGAMLVGAALPPIYARAAALAKRLETLQRTRVDLARRLAEAETTEKALVGARGELAVLLDEKQREAQDAASTYGTLKAVLANVADKASDFTALLVRITRLRREGGTEGVVTVNAADTGGFALAPGSLKPPVVGTQVPGGDSPGLTYATLSGAEVVAPVDGKVLFAGPYHKSGEVLILEITTGYDLVLAGLGHVNVQPNDELLAGEPVGTMPVDGGSDEKLYFELRRDGKGLDPAPWLAPELRKAKKT